ncbi:MAG: hypothetical protein ACFFDN_44040 [Candidatus Hodarchaeota archaeon]
MIEEEPSTFEISKNVRNMSINLHKRNSDGARIFDNRRVYFGNEIAAHYKRFGSKELSHDEISPITAALSILFPKNALLKEQLIYREYSKKSEPINKHKSNFTFINDSHVSIARTNLWSLGIPNAIIDNRLALNVPNWYIERIDIGDIVSNVEERFTEKIKKQKSISRHRTSISSSKIIDVIADEKNKDEIDIGYTNLLYNNYKKVSKKSKSSSQYKENIIVGDLDFESDILEYSSSVTKNRIEEFKNDLIQNFEKDNKISQNTLTSCDIAILSDEKVVKKLFESMKPYLISTAQEIADKTHDDIMIEIRNREKREALQNAFFASLSIFGPVGVFFNVGRHLLKYLYKELKHSK